MLIYEDMHRLGSTVLEIGYNQELFERMMRALIEERDKWLKSKCQKCKKKAEGLIAALEPEFDFVRGMYAIWGRGSELFENSFVKHIADQKGWIYASAWRSYLHKVAECSEDFREAVQSVQARKVEPVLTWSDPEPTELAEHTELAELTEPDTSLPPRAHTQ